MVTKQNKCVRHQSSYCITERCNSDMGKDGAS